MPSGICVSHINTVSSVQYQMNALEKASNSKPHSLGLSAKSYHSKKLTVKFHSVRLMFTAFIPHLIYHFLFILYSNKKKWRERNVRL